MKTKEACGHNLDILRENNFLVVSKGLDSDKMLVPPPLPSFQRSSLNLPSCLKCSQGPTFFSFFSFQGTVYTGFKGIKLAIKKKRVWRHNASAERGGRNATGHETHNGTLDTCNVQGLLCS